MPYALGRFVIGFLIYFVIGCVYVGVRPPDGRGERLLTRDLLVPLSDRR